MASTNVRDIATVFRGAAALVCAALLSVSAVAQTVKNPRASFLDVAAQRAALRKTANPVVLTAVARLPSCVRLPAVAAPAGEMVIPRHYLEGSHGPTNPAEAAATRVYGAFANRVTAGMNQWVANSDEAEARCALDQMADWAEAKALLNYDPETSSQAWYQVEWTASSAGISASVLAQDTKLNAAEQRRVATWLDAVAHKDLSFEKSTDTQNNHHYWRGLAATAIGVTAGDDGLFRFGVATYKEAIGELDRKGAFPKEMARHERALHYQLFALAPLVMTAALAERQGVDLYGYQANGRTLRDAIDFFGRALANPELIRPYAQEDQAVDFGAGSFAPVVIYAARFGTAGLPAALVTGMAQPATDTNLGGSATVLAGR